ncbi:MAG TPA: TIGR03086 family protein [Chloroflexi bacterium]|nr:TIGR03086 family protein [Chloroflexota bacterium]HBV93627.1 TIGR03086 family protein [Chloroflexota bacterium]
MFSAMTGDAGTEISSVAATAALLDAALDQMALVIAGTRPDQLALATPCTDWDVRALLRHMVGGPHLFAAMAQGQKVDPTAPQPDRLGDRDPAAALGDARGALETALRQHPERAARLRPIVAVESAIHSWDLAQATGQVVRLDPVIAERALALVRERLTPAARAGNTAFGPEVPVGAGAPAYDRLAGFLGREP